MATRKQWTEAIGVKVSLRDEFEDRQVWGDTFVGLYHIPPLDTPPGTVLDLGCNIGLTCAHYCTMWPLAQVVGVEMDHDCAELARLNAPSALICEHAVGGANGVASYDPSVRSDSYTLGSGDREVVVYDMKATIARSFPDEHVDYVKMDVEGAEWEIFAEDSWVGTVDTILVELHAEGTSPEIVARGIEALTRLGYQAQHHRRHPQAVWAWRG